MTTHKKVAIFAAILSCSVSSQALAHNPHANAEEIETLKAELLRLAQRIQELESGIAQNAKAADVAQTSAQLAQNTASSAQTAAQSATDTAQAATLAANSAPQVNLKAAPEIKDDRGFSFKPRGRANIDVGFVSAPSATGADSGFDAEARRIRL